MTYDEEYDDISLIKRPRPVLKRIPRQCLKHEDFEEFGVITDKFL